MTRLYLIRHGQAVCNVPPYGKVAGPLGDEGLTERGRLQAERLRDRLAATGEIAADVLIASPLARARQTAEIIAPALALPIIFDDDVQEMRVGEFDGLPWEEVKDRVPDFRQNPFQPFGPGGENWGQFVLRVGTALHRITTEHAGKTIVVVCHGGVVDGSLLYFFGLPTLAPLPTAGLYTRNTSLTLWERQDGTNSANGTNSDAPPRWHLKLYNDDLHTRDIEAPERIRWTRLAKPLPRAQEEPAAPLPTEAPDEA